jgi:transcriptional repressor NrdR
MRCPYCHRDDDRVLDTRAAKDGYVVRRKRICTSCNRRFTTQEQIEQVSVRVVKRDQTREPFDREKIRRGIERACSKRPIKSAKIEEVVQSIESDIYAVFEDELSTDQLGETVMRHLAELDDVAYIRFASVYREFHDVKDFIQAISAIDRSRIESEHTDHHQITTASIQWSHRRTATRFVKLALTERSRVLGLPHGGRPFYQMSSLKPFQRLWIQGRNQP